MDSKYRASCQWPTGHFGLILIARRKCASGNDPARSRSRSKSSCRESSGEMGPPPDKSLAFRLRFYPSTAPRRKPGPWRGGLPCARECPLPPKSACSSRRRQGRRLRLRCHLQTACLPRSSQNPSRAATTSVAEQPVSANCGAQQSDLSWAQPHNAVALNENFLPSSRTPQSSWRKI